MSISLSGMESKLISTTVQIFVSKQHPLIRLAEALDWQGLSDIVVEDLKTTTAKGCWWLGRRIYVRIHLAVYLLQTIFNKTDRQMEADLRENAAYQVFCGQGIVEGWSVPDHTKIEEFRNRLSPQTQKNLVNAIAKRAVELGFGDPSKIDIDSTVQEANIAYPSDSNLMVKLAQKAAKTLQWLQEKATKPIAKDLSIDIGKIKAKAKGYFFMAKNKCIEEKRKAFAELHSLVKREVYKVLTVFESSTCSAEVQHMPWNIKAAYEQVTGLGRRYLLDVAHFIRTYTIKLGKRLSFHAKDIACIVKGKAGKPHEFGRVFQLGRIGGNFVFMNDSESLRMDDKHALPSMLDEHQRTFGEDTLESLATDRGYYSQVNKQTSMPIPDVHLGYQWEGQSEEDFIRLRDRRAGIEPIIGHIKKGGQLGRSRMKSDKATLAAGYGAGVGFNLRQLIRHQAAS